MDCVDDEIKETVRLKRATVPSKESYRWSSHGVH
jgi:hypothetical protein